VSEKPDRSRITSIALRVVATGWVLSLALHLGGLGWAGWGFGSNVVAIPPQESLPVDIISNEQFSQMTRGIKSGDQKIRTPKVDKVAEATPVDDAVGDVTEKKETITTSVAPPPSPPEKKPPEKKPPEKKPVEKKPDPPKPVVENKPKDKPRDPPKPEKKPEPEDVIAEAIKRQDARKPKPETHSAQAQPARPQAAPKARERTYDANAIAALLDHRNPTRQALTGQTVNASASLGTAHGTATTLSQSEFDAMIARLRDLWLIPPVREHMEEQRVSIAIRLGRDRRLIGSPVVVRRGKSQVAQVAAEAAIRALLQGQPYNMLRDETYESWKNMEIDFDPEMMLAR